MPANESNVNELTFVRCVSRLPPSGGTFIKGEKRIPRKEVIKVSFHVESETIPRQGRGRVKERECPGYEFYERAAASNARQTTSSKLVENCDNANDFPSDERATVMHARHVQPKSSFDPESSFIKFLSDWRKYAAFARIIDAIIEGLPCWRFTLLDSATGTCIFTPSNFPESVQLLKLVIFCLIFRDRLLRDGNPIAVTIFFEVLVLRPLFFLRSIFLRFYRRWCSIEGRPCDEQACLVKIKRRANSKALPARRCSRRESASTSGKLVSLAVPVRRDYPAPRARNDSSTIYRKTILRNKSVLESAGEDKGRLRIGAVLNFVHITFHTGKQRSRSLNFYGCSPYRL